MLSGPWGAMRARAQPRERRWRVQRGSTGLKEEEGFAGRRFEYAGARPGSCEWVVRWRIELLSPPRALFFCPPPPQNAADLTVV